MIDAIITYGIVAIAAFVVLWKVILPQRVRMTLRYKVMGTSEACPPEKFEGNCAGGCPGCGLMQNGPQEPKAGGTAGKQPMRTTPAH